MSRRPAREPRPIPRHPYRDSAILYAVLAIVLVVVTAATGGSLLPGEPDKGGVLGAIDRLGALPVGALFFLFATGYSWWRWREQIAGRRGRR